MELENIVKIPDRMYFKIGEVAKIAKVKPFVLRYWETEFSFLAPKKASNNQRMYTRTDVENVLLVKHLLHEQKMTIEGARKKIEEMKKQGEFSLMKKPKFVLTPEKLNLIEKAKNQLAELISMCK
jgi:DNA-binding transcriptional MerR regulator